MMPSLNQCVLISKLLLSRFRKSSFSGLFGKRSNKSLWKAGKAHFSHKDFRYANEVSHTVSSNDLEILENDCFAFCFCGEDILFTTSSRDLTFHCLSLSTFSRLGLSH